MPIQCILVSYSKAHDLYVIVLSVLFRHRVKDVTQHGLCTTRFTMSLGCLIFVAKLSFGAFYVLVTLLRTSFVLTHLTLKTICERDSY